MAQSARAEKKDLEEKQANKLMIANPTLTKRPVFNYDSEIIVGFRARTGGH